MTAQTDIRTKVREVVKLANERYGFSAKFDDIDITFKTRGQAAGSASAKRAPGGKWRYKLMFSLESANLDMAEMLDDTVPHEVAHLVCYDDPSLGKNHNPGWARVCRGLGGSGKRTHSQQLTKARYRTQYLYVMPSGREYKASAQMHKKLQRGQTRRFNDTREQINASCFNRVISSDEHRADHQKKVMAHAKAAAPAARKPAPARKRMATTGTPSKLDQCRNLYSGFYSRQENIDTFVKSAGCTPAGAATYYAKIKKERT